MSKWKKKPYHLPMFKATNMLHDLIYTKLESTPPFSIIYLFFKNCFINSFFGLFNVFDSSRDFHGKQKCQKI